MTGTFVYCYYCASEEQKSTGKQYSVHIIMGYTICADSYTWHHQMETGDSFAKGRLIDAPCSHCILPAMSFFSLLLLNEGWRIPPGLWEHHHLTLSLQSFGSQNDHYVKDFSHIGGMKGRSLGSRKCGPYSF